MSLFVMVRGGTFSMMLASGSAIQFAHRSEASSTVIVRRIYLPQSIRTLRFGNFGWGVGIPSLGAFRLGAAGLTAWDRSRLRTLAACPAVRSSASPHTRIIVRNLEPQQGLRPQNAPRQRPRIVKRPEPLVGLWFRNYLVRSYTPSCATKQKSPEQCRGFYSLSNGD